jgi:hypothetical protein
MKIFWDEITEDFWISPEGNKIPYLKRKAIIENAPEYYITTQIHTPALSQVKRGFNLSRT